METRTLGSFMPRKIREGKLMVSPRSRMPMKNGGERKNMWRE